MSFLRYSLKMLLAPLGDPHSQGERLDKGVKRFAKRIKNAEEEYTSVEHLRKVREEAARRAESILAQSNPIDAPRRAGETLKELKAYHHALAAQIKDIITVITLLEKVIENEDISLFYDCEEAFHILREYHNTIKDALSHSEPGPESATSLKRITAAYDQLIDQTLALIEKDLGMFSSLSSLTKAQFAFTSTEGVASHLKKRSILKEQMTERREDALTTISILLKSLEESHKKPKDPDTLLKGCAEAYTELVAVCQERIDSSIRMVAEAAYLQKEQFQRLEALREEVDRFEKEALRSLERIESSSATRKEFKASLKELKRSLEGFDKELEQMKKKGDEGKLRRGERKEMKKTGRVIEGLKKKGKKLMLTALIASNAVGTSTMGGSSQTTTRMPIEPLPIVQKAALPQSTLPASLPFALRMKYTSIKECGVWVRKMIAEDSRVFGVRGAARRGIGADSWKMLSSITHAELPGTVVFNAFDAIQKKHGNEIEALRAEMKSSRHPHAKKYAERIKGFYPDSVSFDVSQLQVGDMIGLYLQGSKKHTKAFLECAEGTFNTHQGFLTMDKDGMKMISHNLSGRIEHVDASDLLSGKIMIVWVVRPHPADSKTAVAEF